MSIKRYNEKRNFRATPEPAGAKTAAAKTAGAKSKALRFVIQKHSASHLHYDFRLELNGVLKSWAVPKGPSLNPDDKRLAVHVEDHPMAYRSFEGIIPTGNYGAGTVMVWDEGSYFVDASLGKAANEKLLAEGYRKGKLTFQLVGTKLNGEFALVKMRGKNMEDNAWLLIKADDAAADRGSDIRDDDKSAASGRSMVEIATDVQAPVWTSRDASSPKRSASKKSPSVAQATLELAAVAVAMGGKKSAIPEISGPQLATLVDVPFDREGWLFEIKWDGYRTLGFHPARAGRSLVSRNGKNFDHTFPAMHAALQSLPCSAIVDGEIVVLDKAGKPSFALLQNHEQNHEEHGASLVYYLFDLLYVDGVDIRGVPLAERKQLLRALLENTDASLRYSDHVENRGTDFFEAAKENGLEGIIAKDASAVYQSGRRTRYWLKIKIEQRQEFIIAGYTEPRGSRSDIGALVLAYHARGNGKRAGGLRFAGHVGTGMDTSTRAGLKHKLDRLARRTTPFAEIPATNAPVVWVRPELVCEVRYAEKTPDCQLRHPVFIALREDKPARETHWDVPQKTENAVEEVLSDTAPAKKTTGKKAPRKTAATQTSMVTTAAGKPASKTLQPKSAQLKKAQSRKAQLQTVQSKKSQPKTAQLKTDQPKKTQLRKARPKTTHSNKTPVTKALPKKAVKTGDKQKAATRKLPGAAKNAVAVKIKVASAPQTEQGDFAREAPERDKTTLRIGRNSVAVSHPRRVYYPELKITKMEVIDYYRDVAQYLLPYLKDRPFVLHRFPGGIHHEGFYQKDNPQDLPAWIKSTTIHSESTREDINYLVCQNEATLAYLVNLGCLEMNPWNSRIRHIDKPDWMIFDLDPVDIAFAKVVEVAQVIHAIFAGSGVPHYCKTSGKRGLHVVVPLGARYDNDTVREMAESIAQLVHQELPASTSLERSPARRRKKIYLDYLQNGFGKTLVAPYSLRPVDYAGVSAPLHWDEVNARLDPRAFTIKTLRERLASEGDLWRGVLTEAIDLQSLWK